jgi:dTDP-4-dehydrorhamnose reductase
MSDPSGPVLILGAGGQLAGDIGLGLSQRGRPWSGLAHRQLDIRDRSAVAVAIDRFAPSVVINTAAYHRVDEVESHGQLAFAVNAVGSKNVADACHMQGIKMVHISTDYVFSGSAHVPYTESDCPEPINVYGASKLAAEHLVQAILPDSLIVRTAGLYGLAGSSSKRGNFVETMLRVAREEGRASVVTDQVSSPTSTADLAGKIIEMIDEDCEGLYHVVNSGHCSWFEFAEAIFELEHASVSLSPRTSDEFPTPARRPRFSALACDTLASAGLSDMRPWRAALQDYLTQRSAFERHNVVLNPD